MRAPSSWPNYIPKFYLLTSTHWCQDFNMGILRGHTPPDIAHYKKAQEQGTGFLFWYLSPRFAQQSTWSSSTLLGDHARYQGCVLYFLANSCCVNFPNETCSLTTPCDTEEFFWSLLCLVGRCVGLFATLWTVAHQAPLSMGFLK